MTDRFTDPTAIEGYHAHIYYDRATRPAAERLRAGLGERFAARLGNWHDEPVGPHRCAMYQVAFAAGELPRLLPWLMLNRGGLSVLLHPVTGNDYDDHARFALWLGTPLPLRLEVLKGAPPA
jgi:aromatic ring-cleaving dioxygenase